MKKTIIIIFFICGCTSQEKKIQKALNVLESSEDARQRAADVLDKYYPRDNDTTILHDTILQKVELPGKVVKILTPAVCKGISYDTLINGLSIYADSNGLVISGKLEAEVIRDTKTVIDTKRVNRLYDSVQRYIRLVGIQHQETMGVRESLGVSKKETKTWIWYFIGAIAANVVTIVLWAKSGSILKLLKP